MFDIETVKSTTGKMDVRKGSRMHREDEALIKFAASATGLRVSDFVRRAAIMHAREIKRRMSHSVLLARLLMTSRPQSRRQASPYPV